MRQPTDTIALNANQFTWTGQQGVAEASDLEAARLTPFFPTAIRLRSNRSQSEKLFFFGVEMKDNEGEILGWVYHSPDGFRIDIIND